MYITVFDKCWVETDAHDKAENGKRQKMYVVHHFSDTVLKIGCSFFVLLFDVWFYASQFLLRNFSKEFQKGREDTAMGSRFTEIALGLQKCWAWTQEQAPRRTEALERKRRHTSN